MPNGNLAMENGDKVVPVMNACIQKIHNQKLPIYALRDWYLSNHHSYIAQRSPSWFKVIP